MRHFIVTRNSYPPGFPGLDQRAELLRRYVAPSLRNQTCRDFTWVLTSPAGTEGLDLSGIDHVILDLAPPPTFAGTLYMVQEQVWSLTLDMARGDVVVTTRLDNDDMLLPTYVEDVQAQIDGELPLLIDMPGYRVDTRFGRVYRDTFYAPRGVPSPFISMIERKAGKRCRVATSYYDEHTLMHRHFPRAALDRPGWVQLIHGTNKTMSRPEDQVAERGEEIDVSADDFLRAALDERSVEHFSGT